MLKLMAIVSLMLIGSTLWAASLSCDSCGSECASACGTRHFRSCCFNYLRRKRMPELGTKFAALPPHDLREAQSPRGPFIIVENGPTIPDSWTLPSDYKSYPVEDGFGNRLQIVYDM